MIVSIHIYFIDEKSAKNRSRETNKAVKNTVPRINKLNVDIAKETEEASIVCSMFVRYIQVPISYM